MFDIDAAGNIRMSRGDTAAFTVGVSRKDGAPFSELDRAVFTVKNSAGVEIMYRIYPIASGEFRVSFSNADTDSLPTGSYSYDIRYVIDPNYDDNGRIIDGNEVLTPMQPKTITLIATVGAV